MKSLKHFVIYLSIFCILTISIFSVNSRKVYADVPSSQKIVKHNSSWISPPFTFYSDDVYYTIEDKGSLPNGSYVAPKYFYTLDNETFYTTSGLNIFTTTLNALLGIIINPSTLNNLYVQWTGFEKIFDNVNNKYVRNGVYDSNDNFLGIAINDIEGCYYAYGTSDDVIVDPDYQKNVRNFYDYVNDNSVEFFTYYPSSSEYVLQHINATDMQRVEPSVVGALSNNNQYMYYGYFAHISGDSYFSFTLTQYKVNKSAAYARIVNNSHGIHTTQNNNYTNWIKFCNTYGLINGNQSLYFSDLKDYMDGPTVENVQIAFNLYDNTTGSLSGADPIWLTDATTNTSPNVNWSAGQQIGVSNNQMMYCPLGKGITIYKNADAYNGIKDKTYSPDSYKTDTYYNYDPNNVTSTNIDNSVVDNSVQNNSNIYYESTSDYYNYVSESTVNTEEIQNNVTNITNNYYNNGSGEDNPSNPDNPSDPDDGVLDSILQALLRFFQAIGRIIGTVLAGIIEVVDAILESLAGIVEGLTGVTDFIAALFSWIPSPVPQVLGVGLSICILAAIIKFIRG